MPKITSDSIYDSFTNRCVCAENENVKYICPRNLEAAIKSCLLEQDNSLIQVEIVRLIAEYKKYQTGSEEPIDINYENELTLDAYTTYYLPRYSIIPYLAFRDLSFHPDFCQIPKNVNILDLGSGTGAIVLGLLELFHTRPLSFCNLNITAVENSARAIERQKNIIKQTGFSQDNVIYEQVDLNNIDAWLGKVAAPTPYDYIFVSNCLTELKLESATRIIKSLVSILSLRGAAIIAEPNYTTRKYMRALTNCALDQGLSIYYPCPPNVRCRKDGCWVWRYHKYDMQNAQLASLANDREHLTTGWLILTKQKASIYDHLIDNSANIRWMPISDAPSTLRQGAACTWAYRACYGQSEISFDVPNESILNRGDIVGLVDNSPYGFSLKEHVQLGATPD